MVEEIVLASEVSHLRLLDEFTATEGEDHVLDVQRRIKGLFRFSFALMSYLMVNNLNFIQLVKMKELLAKVCHDI